MFNKAIPYLLLIIVYTFFRLPDILAVKELSCVLFPLDSLYIANHLLFSGWHVNPQLTHTVIAPPNATFIYPPGLYFFTKMLGTVRNIFIFLFFVQLFVPLLIFRLLKTIAPLTMAFLCAVLASYYLTCAYWWSPDWIVQPLLLCIVLILAGRGDRKQYSFIEIVAAGGLTGLIMILKHNIGIITTIVVLTWFLMNFLEAGPKSKRNLKMLLFLTAGYLCFGMMVGKKLVHFDEYILYLLSFFLFWGMFIYFCFKTTGLRLNMGNFVKSFGIFFSSMLVIPAVIFVYFGSSIGFTRYAHSFFMGLGYAPIWELSYLNVIGKYCDFAGPKEIYASLVHIGLFLLPLVVNICVIFRLVGIMQNKRATFNEIQKFLKVASLSIVGVFLFYPMEGNHCLVTRLFIFIYVLFYIFQEFCIQKKFLISLVLGLFVVPLLLLGGSSWAGIIRHSMATEDPPRLHGTIGMPVRSDIAEELLKEIHVMERSIKGSSYYIVGQDKLDYDHFLAIVNDPYKQYYIFMLKGVLRSETVNAINKDLGAVNYVVVAADDYKKYLAGNYDDIYFKAILDTIHQRFKEVDRYEAPAGGSRGTEFHSFLVMKKTAPI